MIRIYHITCYMIHYCYILRESRSMSLSAIFDMVIESADIKCVLRLYNTKYKSDLTRHPKKLINFVIIKKWLLKVGPLIK